MPEGTCCDCLKAPFRALWLLSWPVLSIVLGIPTGILFSGFITLTVFLITLIRTPMHVLKMLHVTATSEECFKGHLSLVLRVIVFVVVPLVHVIFLVGITVFSATIGTLYYVGRSTKIFFKHEYRKTMKTIESNAKLEKKSYLGKYITACRDYMAEDDISESTIFFLKGFVATVPGLVLASLVFVPFSLAVIAITLYRLPINVYKTMKIALFTVALNWDLRLVVLAMLPLIHTCFPLVAFFTSMIGSFFWTWYQAAKNITQGDSPFRILNELSESLEKYHQAHKEFISNQCHRYDHPSGIPYGWDGTSYGIEIERILKRQRDFVLCCLLILIEIPVCLAVCILISVIKYIPSCLCGWRSYVKEYCCTGDQSCVNILSIWPFHVIAVVMLPVQALLCQLFLILLPILRVIMEMPWGYLVDRKSLRWAWGVQFEFIIDHDEVTGALCDEIKIFGKADRPAIDHGATREEQRTESVTSPGDSISTCWDRFASQCICTTASLTNEGWLSPDDVQSMEPAVIQSIPAVAILQVLADSINEEGLADGDVKWSCDGTICKESKRSFDDGIIDHLWPMVRQIKLSLQTKRGQLLTKDNMEVLTAMLCANSGETSEKIRSILENTDMTSHSMNNGIRTKINRLVLAILRVKPYQERMKTIFTHKYDSLDIESGNTEAKQKRDTDGSTPADDGSESDSLHIDATRSPSCETVPTMSKVTPERRLTI